MFTLKLRPKQRLKPPHFKERTEGLPIRKMPIAPGVELILPLLQHTGSPCRPKVSVGETIQAGQLVADAQEYVSAPIHAPASGKVKAIEVRPHPVLGEDKAIVIESDGQSTLDKNITNRPDVDTLSSDEIKRIIRRCGIVGLGGAAFPTHVKLAPPKQVDTFILNGAECEPFLTADHRLMIERADEIIAGMKIAMKVLNASVGILAIEENKGDAIDMFKKKVEGNIKVAVLSSFYPQGAEKQLIKAVLHREVPARGLPFEVGVVVNNAATCFAIYEAVYKNKPLFERVITVSGRIVKNPMNVLVGIGTKVKDIVEFCGGLSEEPAKVIFGGPMMGLAQYTLQVPIIKGISGIIFFSKEQLKKPAHQPCICCSRCLQVCPMRLNPQALARAIEKGRFDSALEENVLDCSECGICSYVCPGNRDVVGLVKLAKQKLSNKDSIK